MRALSIAAVLCLAVAPVVRAAPHGGLEAAAAWSRPAVAGTTGVGYLTLANHGRRAVTLMTVTSPAAARGEIHAMSMDGPVMSMRKFDHLQVPAGGQLVFGPGGYHLMLIGLTRTLKAGDRLPAELGFAGGARLKVAFRVTAGAGPPPPMPAPGR